jgi:hypothetical protein
LTGEHPVIHIDHDYVGRLENARRYNPFDATTEAPVVMLANAVYYPRIVHAQGAVIPEDPHENNAPAPEEIDLGLPPTPGMGGFLGGSQ